VTLREVRERKGREEREVEEQEEELQTTKLHLERWRSMGEIPEFGRTAEVKSATEVVA
jgi:hypothetical protein